MLSLLELHRVAHVTWFPLLRIDTDFPIQLAFVPSSLVDTMHLQLQHEALESELALHSRIQVLVL